MGLVRPLRLSPPLSSSAATATPLGIFSPNPPPISRSTVGSFSAFRSSSFGHRSFILGRRELSVGTVVKMAAQPPGPVQKSEDEWRAVLSPEQFRILRMKGTEDVQALLVVSSFVEAGVACPCPYPRTGEYDKFFEEGVYNCAGCGTPLYRSTTKFNSGCGWPAFYEDLPGAITRNPDPNGRRTVITCAACGGHLGHVFKGEGFPTPTNEWHCINSISLKFLPASSSPSQ